MERIVHHHCRERPHALAVIDGSRCLTYRELVAESTHLARILCKFELDHEEPVGILLGVGIKQVVAQLAVLIAGCTCVPIEPSAPQMRITNMLQDINVKIIILEENGPYASEIFENVYLGNIGERKILDCDFELRPHHDVRRSHILFTSGSTGKPKPVQIDANSIVHLATKTPVTPLLFGDRVAEFNNPGFDLSLFEIWVTILSGATVVATPKMIATDPMTLQLFLEEHKITVLIMTAALFEIIASTSPSTFHNLRHVLTAGDIANKRAMRSVLKSDPPEHLWNTYGPTECTTLATMFQVTLEETGRDRISIGHAIGEMQIYLLDDELKPVYETGRRGEICIAGPQQSAGYLNRSSENEKCFIEMSKSNLGDEKVGTNSSNIRLYRTGDIGEWLPGGSDLDFVGRIDNQVKHGGFRVELEEIEKVLLEASLVKLAIVVRRPALQTNCSASLVAFVVPEDEREFNNEDLFQFARQKLPFYMLPDTIVAVAEFPMTYNGKVDRKALLARSIKSLQNKREEVSCDGDAGTMNRRSALKTICKDILNVQCIADEDDLFALGLSSLQAAMLIATLNQRLGCLVTMRNLYESSRLSCLLKLLEVAHEEKSGDMPVCTADCAREIFTDAPDDTAAWSKDVDLADEIEDVPDWQAEDEGRVFITGATGFVGAFFLQHLLNDPRVKQIACLARSYGSFSPTQRIQKNMEQYDLWPPNFDLPHKLIVIEGDIKEEKLGVGNKKYNWLTNWTSVIFHIAAKANYCEPYRGHFADNVLGTRNMLCFAATGRRKSFHYMSSIDVWGPAGFFLGRQVVLEDDPLQPYAQGLRYALGYAQSQWTAEGMVRRMRDRGLPVIIYRPGFIIGHSGTGASNPNDFMSRVIVGCIQLKAFPKLTQRLEYVTVDYVVEATMHIAASRKNLGSSYTLLSPTLATSVSMEETYSLLIQAGYKDLRLVDYRRWVNQVAKMQEPPGPLVPLIPFFEEKVLGGLTRWEVSQYSSFFDSQNTTRALADRADVQYKPLDAEMLKRFISFWNRKGFYNVQAGL
ncbi:hypothetical protein B7494_g2007 [Chlorociboria aeruginascens]|nr:hypothetical protein B7494_g2007 [Chlorociboria aeruginascens]